MRLQGRVKFPTGGKVREPKGRTVATTVPIVKVWMEEETMIKNIFLLGMMMSTPLVYAGGVDESEPFGSNSQSAKHDFTVTLQEVSVRANFANEQVTPLNLTTITSQSLRIHTTAPNYVEVMQCVPGVYATSTSGSYGDASLNIQRDGSFGYHLLNI